jgi:hypothetical protein
MTIFGKKVRLAGGDVLSQVPAHRRRDYHILLSVPQMDGTADVLEQESPRPPIKQAIGCGSADAMA